MKEKHLLKTFKMAAERRDCDQLATPPLPPAPACTSCQRPTTSGGATLRQKMFQSSRSPSVSRHSSPEKGPRRATIGHHVVDRHGDRAAARVRVT